MTEADDEDKRREALDLAIRWAEAVLVQIERLGDIERVLAADALRGTPRPAYTQAVREPFNRLRTDAHFLFIAGRNLTVALETLSACGPQINIPSQLAKDVKTLRDCFEHWNERADAATTGTRGRAYRELRKRFPNDDPGSYSFGTSRKIGGVDVGELEECIRPLLKDLLELESGNFVWGGWSYR